MRSNNLLEHVYLCLRKYLWLWLTPAVVFFVLSVGYNKFWATKTYTARQSLILRDDLLGDAYKPSRFESQESLQSAQETILEIARKPQVVSAVLQQLGPVRSLFSFGGGDYPSAETIEDVQGNISLSAPNGAEFGKTEAVVLSVKTVDADRSSKFVTVLLDEIDAKLSEVRSLRLASMRNELSQAGENAMKSLNDSSQRLQELEKSFGAGITTIRGLNDPQGSGGFDLKLNQIRLEQRQAAAQLSSARQQRQLLTQAQQNGGAEFVTSNELLELQPALQGIMTNLSTAMAQLAIDQGRYTSLHPQLRRSQRAVKQQKQQLFDSIGTTIKGLDSQIETLTALEQRLGDSVVQLETRLQKLTEQRVPYATLEEEVKKKSEVYNDVQGQLAQVQSYANATSKVAMLTRVDEPQVSSRPDQIGAFNAGAIGAAIGLMLGLGLVALMAPPFVDPRTSHPAEVPMHREGDVSGVTPAAKVPPTRQEPPTPKPTQARSQTQPAPQPAPPRETHAESRLKSVTARQRLTPDATDPLGKKLARDEGLGAATSVANEPAEPAISDSIAQHMSAMKQRVEGGERVQNPKVGSPPKVDAGATQVAASDRPEPPRQASSEDVIAELKKMRDEKRGPQTNAPTNPPSVAGGKATTQAQKSKTPANDDVVVQRRPALSSLSTAALEASNAAASTEPNPQTPAGSVEKPEIVAVGRIRSPRVPDSITEGRITAESLLKSAEKKEVPDVGVKSSAELQEKVASLANDPLPANIPEGGVQQPGVKSEDPRIPSITDYARALDRKLGTTEGDRIADSIKDPASKFRASNVRPVDIAKSAQDPSLLRSPADNIQPNEASADSSKAESRSESISDYVSAMDNSVAGLVRGAKGTDVDQAAVRQGADSVVPTEKSAAKPAATPVPRENLSSSSIPAQIQQLSGSFSSFARSKEQK